MTPSAVLDAHRSTRYAWLTVKEACARAKCGPKMIYRAISTGQLRASRLGVRNDYRILEPWLDAWMISRSAPTVVNPDAPGAEYDPVDQPTDGLYPNRARPKGGQSHE